MFNRHARSASILLSAALLFSVIPLTASAAEATTVTVQVNDLNLNSDIGRTVLRSRIDQAIEQVCGDVHMRTTWALRAGAISCTNAARAGAMSQFDVLVAAARSTKKVAADSNNTPPVR
jgi:UrcA family protein